MVCFYSGNFVPDRIELEDRAEPAAPVEPWPPSYLHGRSEQDDPWKRNTELKGSVGGMFDLIIPSVIKFHNLLLSVLLLYMNNTFPCN